MGLIAAVENGKVVETAASASTDSAKKSSTSSLDKEAFLQLLVAQMKYQDPLEPTSNTEYIAQLATFSQLEEMQNLSSTMDIAQASDLVGKNVIMKTVSATTGETYYTTGKVDYIVVESGEAYLAINDSLYALSDLDTVVDEDYLDELEAASSTKTATTV